MEIKNKKSLIYVILVFIVFLVLGTIAYFTSTDTLENIFLSGTYKTVTTEVFTSPTNWTPGDETPKTITTKNEGTIPVRVRVKLDESWTSKNNDSLDLDYNNERVAIINLDNEEDWILKDGYYYYLQELAPGESTTSLLKSVIFNPNVEADVSCTFENGASTCESTGDGYDGATYQLNITTETVQANKYKEVWEGAPIMYDYVGDNPCTFDGELTPGAEYVNGQYTYRYRQESLGTSWENISDNGWGVKLTDTNSTVPVTSTLCTSINNKPIVSMSGTFFESQAESIDLSSFDTSNVTNMRGMFSKSQTGNLNLSSFDTSKVTNMQSMFALTKVSTLDLSNFDTSNVTNMRSMFSLSNLSNLNVSSFDTSNVTDMTSMFQICKIPVLDLSSFDTSNVTSMKSMFMGQVGNLTITERIIGIENFDTSNVTDMQAMFQRCEFLENLDLSNWDTSNVITMHGLFIYCSSLENLNLSNWNTSNLENTRGMFQGCTSLTSLDLSSFDTSKVVNMRGMFQDCNLLQTIYVSNKWNTNAVDDSIGMFMNCTSLNGFDSTKTDVSMATTNGGYLTLKSI